MADKVFYMMEENMIDAEEFVYAQRRLAGINLHLEQPYWTYPRFSLEDMADEECWVEMRFKKTIYIDLL